MNFKKLINAETISLTEIGWTEYRNDTQIKHYIKAFIKNNYERNIDDGIAVIILFILDDLLTSIEEKKEKTWQKNY